MTGLPPDYHDELQFIHDFIRQTQSNPSTFWSFHWMIATEDRRRFVASSDTTDGIVDLTPLKHSLPPHAAILTIVDTILSLPHVFAINMRLELAPITIKDIQAEFGRAAPDRLLSVVASGRRVAENTPWSLNMIFAGFNDPSAFLRVNQHLIAMTKPLQGNLLYSKRQRTEA